MTTADLAYQKLQAMPEIVQQQVLDYIDFLSQKWQKTIPIMENMTEEDNSQKALAVMKEIASRGTAFADIDDVMAWQKEVRQDRPLPFRD